ncbi:uncharacterized protein LOC135138192 isoform X2 [Zophobas morio]|uniref:uncharacterized protein LOC135138192 isoform X2 n=1 Tax=Zophobas morio TaxID=2755281 RepID=UPI003083532E
MDTSKPSRSEAHGLLDESISSTSTACCNSQIVDAKLSENMSKLSVQNNLSSKRGLVEPQQSTISSKRDKHSNQSQNVTPQTETTYSKRKGTVDYGRGYEYLTCALFALKFSTSDDVTDFRIFTNDQISGNFDDIRIEVTFNSGKQHTFLFQLKHKYNKERITNDTLMKEYIQKGKKQEKNKFHLPSYLKCISEIDSKENTTFILYTNSPTNIERDSKLSSKKYSFRAEESRSFEFDNLLLNTEDTRSVWQFKVDGNCGDETEQLKNACEMFYLFSNQACIETVRKRIKSLVEDLVHCDIFDSFTKYMEDWWCQNFVLTKDDILGKLATLATYPFIETISSKPMNEKIQLLKHMMIQFEITMVENSEKEIVKNMWGEIHQELDWKSTHFINLEVNDYKPTDLEKSIILWYLGTVPLILRVDDSNVMLINDVVALLRKKVSATKLVLVGDTTGIDSDKWKVFTNLADVMKRCCDEENYLHIMDDFRISLQGRESISLRQLIDTDSNIAEFIKIKHLFIMARQQHILIGEEGKKLHDLHVVRSVSAVLLNKKHLLKLYNAPENLIIINCHEKLQDLLPRMNSIKTVQLPTYFSNENIQAHDRFVLLSTGNRCTSVEFDKICKISNARNIYLLQVLDDDRFMLLFKKNNDLPPDHQKICIEESKIFDYFSNSPNVLCAPPGMGKSRLMQCLHNTCPNDCWAIYVDLIKYHSLLSTNPTFQSIETTVLETNVPTSDLLVTQIKNMLWQKGKVHVFLDGLDEMKTEYVCAVFHFVKELCSRNISVWISSRENLRKQIFQNLRAVAVEILELEREQQEKYIDDRLKDAYEIEAIEKIKTAVFYNVNLNNSRELLGIPLQLYILTEIFLKSKETYESLQQSIFVLTQMYKVFFDGKLKTAMLKVAGEYQDHQFILMDFIFNLYEILALKTCLNDFDFEKLHLNNTKTDKYISEIKENGDKYGIIKDVTKSGEAVFYHQTFAEYFACSWLNNNRDKVLLLREEIFSNKYENLRLMLDIMLAEKNPLHLAIIYKSIDYFENNITNINIRDEGGRSGLHLVCTYGIKYPEVQVALVEISKEEDWYLQMIKRLIKDLSVSETDVLFKFDCLDYSVASKCLYPLELFLERQVVSYNDFKDKILKSYDEESLAYYAAKLGYPNILSAVIKENPELVHKRIYDSHLLEIATLGLENDVCTTPRQDNISVVKLLLQNGAEPNKENNGFTVLDQICRFRKYDMVLVLLEKEARCSSGNTILHQLIKSSVELSVLENIFQSVDLDVDAKNDNGVTALHLACEHGSFDIAKLLIKKNANVQALDDNNKNALHYACQAPENSEVITKLLIENNVDINCQDKWGNTALHFACEYGNIEVIQNLVEGGADVNLGNSKGENVLHCTSKAQTNCEEIIILLLKCGIGIDSRANMGTTPLQLACKHGNYKATNSLLKHGANVNCIDHIGENALHHSLDLNDNMEVINLLLSNGIDINAQNERGTTVLQLACQYNNFESAKTFLDNGSDINMTDNDKNTALHYVCYNEAENDWWSDISIKLLIDNGIDINAQNTTGTTALHIACQNANWELTEILVENKASVDIKDHDDKNALHCALRSGIYDDSIFELLVAESFDVDAADKYGTTPLKLASQFGYFDIMESLIAKGAKFSSTSAVNPGENAILIETENVDVDEKDKNGSTALQRVCRDTGDIETVKQLLKLGAEVNNTDNNKDSALHYASGSDVENADLINLLISYITNVDVQNKDGLTPLHLACETGKFLTAKILLEHGADGNLVDKYNQNALHYAASEENQNEELIRLLVNRSVDVNAQDIDGITPLQVACQKCNYVVTKSLLENGANAKVVDMDYRNALHYALSTEKPNEDIIHLLTQNGADVNAKDNDGTTAVHLACRAGNLNILNLLLQNRGELRLLDNDGENVLHYAASQKNRDINLILLLIRNGLSVNSKDNTKTTPLHLACEHGNMVVAQTLLSKGAEVDSLDTEKENALHYAMCTTNNNSGILRLLINGGIDINAQNSEGATPLHLACNRENNLFVYELLKNGALINVLDNDNETVLHYAVRKLNEETSFGLSLLLKFGVDINAQNNEGTTALQLACQGGLLSYVETLILHRANVNVRDNGNKNALDYISKTSKYKLDIENLLVLRGIDRNDVN